MRFIPIVNPGLKRLWVIIFLLPIIIGCQPKEQEDYVDKVDWNNRIAGDINYDELDSGKSYLPIYSHIYHIHGNRYYDLTVTVSMRNISLKDTLYLSKADYYNTEGVKIRSYLNKPVYLAPMETIEIIIEDADREGGSGANFIFDWAIQDADRSPLFEAVMISSEGQQGISFTTRGVSID